MAQPKLNLVNMFPALGNWLQQNQYAARAPMRQQAETLLGAPAAAAVNYTPFDGNYLTSGVSTIGSGLMQAPDDDRNRMNFAQSLMQVPGYEQIGAQYAQAYQQDMLARPQRQAEAALALEKWAAEQQNNRAIRSEAAQRLAIEQQKAAREAAEAQRKEAMRYGPSGMFENVTDYTTVANTLRDDAYQELAPVRESAQLFANVQDTVRRKGFANMSVTDDVVLTKSLAKLLLPKEAVMEGDITALQTMEGLPALVKGFAAKLSMGKKLEPDERRQLYDQLFALGQQRVGELGELRSSYEERAAKRFVRPGDVLSPLLNIDTQDMRELFPDNTTPGPVRVPPVGGNQPAQPSIKINPDTNLPYGLTPWP
jgi:hypothetical protein